jgi:putative membrane protein
MVLLCSFASAKTGKANVSASDKKFVMAAAQGGMAEVKLGELATKNGASESVKKFGQKMVDDHSKANDELKEVATTKGITLPSDVDAKSKATMAKLSKLHGAAFDAAYIKDMKTGHQQAIADFTKESSTGQDADIKGFASKTLPVIKGHYSMISDMAKGKMSTKMSKKM